MVQYSLCVDSLYAEAIEAMKLLAAFTASSIMSMWIQGEIKSEARPQNCSQSVWVSIGTKISLVLT
jgi:hypothetical protein